jgi:hypothetical protein
LRPLVGLSMDLSFRGLTEQAERFIELHTHLSAPDGIVHHAVHRSRLSALILSIKRLPGRSPNDGMTSLVNVEGV